MLSVIINIKVLEIFTFFSESSKSGVYSALRAYISLD